MTRVKQEGAGDGSDHDASHGSDTTESGDSIISSMTHIMMPQDRRLRLLCSFLHPSGNEAADAAAAAPSALCYERTKAGRGAY